MSNIEFDWDGHKASANIRKHGVSFEEAKTVFYDDLALFMEDPEHSLTEERFLLLGISNRLRVLVVSHCYRQDHDLIRIISARVASKQEKKTYEVRL